MDGSLKFSEQPFMSIMGDLERKFNVRIRVESDPFEKGNLLRQLYERLFVG